MRLKRKQQRQSDADRIIEAIQLLQQTIVRVHERNAKVAGTWTSNDRILVNMSTRELRRNAAAARR